MEWDGTRWQGAHYYGEVVLAPPQNCGQRAFWMSQWTPGGEGIGLKLTQPIEAGKAYSFRFTYASDGTQSRDAFAPYIGTMSDEKKLLKAVFSGRLPPTANEWRTETFTFTATTEQAGHSWLVVYCDDDAGIVLSNCMGEHPLFAQDLISYQDTTVCIGDPFAITLPTGTYQYIWSTGETSSAISPAYDGTFTASVKYLDCEVSDTLSVQFEDCQVRFNMPNFFSPNETDDDNSLFIPYDYNYLDTGTIQLYNRWGKLVYTGDLFSGWDGRSEGHEMPDAVYYYVAQFSDRTGKSYVRKGWVRLCR
jgi:gliding motility-associated-like protein